MRQTHTRAGASMEMAASASGEPMKSARMRLKISMNRVLVMPRTKKAALATRKVRRSWFRRPRASATETMRLRATGRPAVERVSSRA